MSFINRTAINVTPTVLIGCGGRGTASVEYCNRLVRQELFPGENGEFRLANLPALRFIAIDSNIQGIDGGVPHHLDPIAIAASDIETALNDPSYPAAGARPINVLRTMPPGRDYKSVLNRLPGLDEGNCTCPPIGTINFMLSWESIRVALKQQLQKWQQAPPNDLPFQCASFNTQKTIYIVAGLYGGTGCGIHLHMAAMVRHLLREMEITNVSTCGIFFLPDIVQDATPPSKKKLRANAYAALKEIDYFLSGTPFILELGDDTVRVENSGTDYLFHNVFFVNDRNLESQRLTANQAAEMAGELMFHRCATTFGSYLNQRLTDAPNSHHNSFAPRDDSRYRSGQRITAYSTFGLANVTIPYETLRWNLTVDFALEMMNSLLLLPDHDSEVNEVKLLRESLRTSTLKGDGLLRELGLTLEQLHRVPGFGMKLPDFLTGTASFGGEKLEDYMKQTGCKTIAEVIAHIKTEIAATLPPPKQIDNKAIDDLEIALRTELERRKNALIKKGGPEFAHQIFMALHESLQLQYQANKEKAGAKNNSNLVQLRLNTADTFLERRKENYFTKNSLRREFQTAYFRLIKETCSSRLECERADRMLPVLERINRVFESFELDLKDDHSSFMAIHRLINSKRRLYRFSPRLVNAVANDALLARFVENFRYPAGSTPEDGAEDLRREGLSVNSQIINVSDFDDHPDREAVVDALLTFAKNTIDSCDSTLWGRSFTESGFFPQEGLSGGDLTESGVPDDAYRRVYDDLVSHSAPFLEYNRGEKFDIHSTTILLHPTRTEGFLDVEADLWKSFPWPPEQHFLINDNESRHGNYSLTCFQFHFGLPLYSIDEIEQWKKDYEFLLKYDDKPLHKTHLPMPEPYINVTGESGYMESDLKACLDWSLEINPQYPVFCNLESLILDALADPAVMGFYYTLRENTFLDRTRLAEFMQAQVIDLFPLVERELKRLFAIAGQAQHDLYRQLVTDRDKLSILLSLFDMLVDVSFQPALTPQPLLKVIRDGDECKYFIDPDITPDEGLRKKLARNFQAPLANPILKTGIDKELLLNEIKSNAAFRDCFITKCLEAASHLRWMGQTESSFPESLREKEA